jgi:hypothetical protein
MSLVRQASAFLALLSSGLAFGTVTSTAQATPTYTLTDSQGTMVITPFVDDLTDAQFYDYYNSSGHPPFTLVPGQTTFFLHEDVATGSLGLGVIYYGTAAGQALTALSGLPGTASFSVQDDQPAPPDGDQYSLTSSTANTNNSWAGGYTDGWIIDGLQNSDWNIQVILSDTIALNDLVFATGNETDPTYISIAGPSTFTVTEVPEPSTLVLFATGIAGLAGFRRKFLRKFRPTRV